MDRALTVFMWIWVAMVLLLNLVGIAGAFIARPFWEAVDQVQQWYSPFNLVNWGLNLVLLSPALGAAKWRAIRRRRLQATVP